MVSRNGFALVCVLLVIVLCGCYTYAPEGGGTGVRVNDPRAPRAGVQYNRVVTLDKSLQNWDAKVYNPEWLSLFSQGPKEKHKYARLAVENTDWNRTPTGTLEVWATLRNRTNYDMQIEGRTQFFDGKGKQVERTAWQRLHLPPQGVDEYRAFSTNVHDIEYYYVEIREGR